MAMYVQSGASFMRPKGRPIKYRFVIVSLEPETLYTPASIARFAEENDLLPGTTSGEKKLNYQRLRITLGRFSNNHYFPDEGDGMVLLKGQPPYPGWFGWRWLDAMR